LFSALVKLQRLANKFPFIEPHPCLSMPLWRLSEVSAQALPWRPFEVHGQRGWHGARNYADDKS
jgi:hypothetical protein